MGQRVHQPERLARVELRLLLQVSARRAKRQAVLNVGLQKLAINLSRKREPTTWLRDAHEAVEVMK